MQNTGASARKEAWVVLHCLFASIYYRPRDSRLRIEHHSSVQRSLERHASGDVELLIQQICPRCQHNAMDRRVVEQRN